MARIKLTDVTAHESRRLSIGLTATICNGDELRAKRGDRPGIVNVPPGTYRVICCNPVRIRRTAGGETFTIHGDNV